MELIFVGFQCLNFISFKKELKKIKTENEERKKINIDENFIDEDDENIISETNNMINLERVLLENVKNMDVLKLFGSIVTETSKIAE